MTKTSPAPLLELLIEVRDQLGSNHALAQALGLSDSRTGRLLKGIDSLNTLNCLKFAQLSGKHPSDILRAAGKHDIADAIETMYGKANKPQTAPVTPAEIELLNNWRGLPARAQQTVRVLTREMKTGKEREEPRSNDRDNKNVSTRKRGA